MGILRLSFLSMGGFLLPISLLGTSRIALNQMLHGKCPSWICTLHLSVRERPLYITRSLRLADHTQQKFNASEKGTSKAILHPSLASETMLLHVDNLLFAFGSSENRTITWITLSTDRLVHIIPSWNVKFSGQEKRCLWNHVSSQNPCTFNAKWWLEVVLLACTHAVQPQSVGRA